VGIAARAPAAHFNKFDERERKSAMALLERVSTLLRANINDLLSKAEDPEKLARNLYWIWRTN